MVYLAFQRNLLHRVYDNPFVFCYIFVLNHNFVQFLFCHLLKNNILIFQKNYDCVHVNKTYKYNYLDIHYYLIFGCHYYI